MRLHLHHNLQGFWQRQRSGEQLRRDTRIWRAVGAHSHLQHLEACHVRQRCNHALHWIVFVHTERQSCTVALIVWKTAAALALEHLPQSDRVRPGRDILKAVYEVEARIEDRRVAPADCGSGGGEGGVGLALQGALGVVQTGFVVRAHTPEDGVRPDAGGDLEEQADLQARGFSNCGTAVLMHAEEESTGAGTEHSGPENVMMIAQHMQIGQ